MSTFLNLRIISVRNEQVICGSITEGPVHLLLLEEHKSRTRQCSCRVYDMIWDTAESNINIILKLNTIIKPSVDDVGGNHDIVPASSGPLYTAPCESQPPSKKIKNNESKAGPVHENPLSSKQGETVVYNYIRKFRIFKSDNQVQFF